MIGSLRSSVKSVYWQRLPYTVQFRDIETTFLTQPACVQAHTDEVSTQPASVVLDARQEEGPGAAARHSLSARVHTHFLNKKKIIKKSDVR